MNKKWIAGIVIGSLLTLAVFNRKTVTAALLEPEQEAYISELHPIAQNLFRTFINEVQNTGWYIVITSGYRTWYEQAQQHAANSSNAEPGYSYHNYGLAIDINAFDGTTWLRKATDKQTWINSGIPQIAENLGLKWGANIPGYYDPVHFYYPVATTAQLHSLAVSQFGSNPNYIYGNQVLLAA